jgi:arabinofuranosyltransferase
LKPTRGEALILVAAGALAVAGWREFWFLTDDAFIAFRYAQNAAFGFGYVWNPPPFRPVEGYTSALWLALLDGTWRATGVEPPRSANVISLCFALATLALVGLRLLRLALPARLAPLRPLLLALALGGIVTNRSFLAWTSSGLETALFNFCATAWLLTAFSAPARAGRGWIVALAASAAALALTRPEGTLAVAASAVILLERARRGAVPRPRDLAAAAPLLASPLHFLLRRSFYGEWLPNTYYVRAGPWWPESGIRYLASFVLEYALWLWLAVVILAALRVLRARGPAPLVERAPGAIALATLLFALAWYTFAIGGDHFEYRVYSWTVPLVFLSFVWALARLELRPPAAAVLLAAFVVASWPLPWAHHLATRRLEARAETFKMFRPVAPLLPWPLAPYARGFDELQRWLIEHFVCVRHQEHRAYWRQQLAAYPDREFGLGFERGRLAVMVGKAVGVPGWVLPHVAILDYWGLNDRVIARTPPLHLSGEPRNLAHDRRPPPGYLECFQPNVLHDPERGLLVAPRSAPLTAERIRACEQFDSRGPAR